MSHAHSHDYRVPPHLLSAAGGLVIACLVLTVMVRIGWIERAAVPEAARAEAQVAPLEVRELTFADRADGAVIVTDAATGALVAEVRTDTPSSGFIRGVLRGFARDRRMRDVGAAPPFTLTLWQDGSLSLADEAIGRSVELGGFGADNRAAFMALLQQGEGR